MERWTCSDTGRAIRESGARLRAERAAQSVPSADEALMTLAKLLTGAGGDIPDAEVRALERWLDQQPVQPKERAP
jgi:hypothetical protein